MKVQWCWKCRKNVAMLDDAEFKRVTALHGQELLDEYFKITGHHETDRSKIWHHHLSIYGDPCPQCHKPLRVKGILKCFECGWREEDEE